MQSRLLGGLLLVAALAAPLALPLVGCDEPRFPACRSNADCVERDGGKFGNVCLNLRCVECQYDTDCPVGKVCGSKNVCEGLGGPSPSASDDAPKAWDPKDWNECAKDCKDPACIQACDQRFKK
jgi:hypothetical protein